MNSYMPVQTELCESLDLDNTKKSRWTKPVQDYYPDNFANCFGCGRNNEYGLNTKTYWDEDKEIGICNPKPDSYHCGYKGVFHGGLISSVIECNSVATSIAATYDAEDLDPEVDRVFYVLGSILSTNFILPVPINSHNIVVKTKVVELKPKKAKCQVSLYANELLCTTAETIAVRVPSDVIKGQFVADNR